MPFPYTTKEFSQIDRGLGSQATLLPPKM